MSNKIGFVVDNYNSVEGDIQRVSNVGDGVQKKVQLWRVVGELANINLIMIQLGGYEEEKNYNYQCREIKLMSKDIIT